MAVLTTAEGGGDREEVLVGFVLKLQDGGIGGISDDWRQGWMREVAAPVVGFTHGWHVDKIIRCDT